MIFVAPVMLQSYIEDGDFAAASRVIAPSASSDGSFLMPNSNRHVWALLIAASALLFPLNLVAQNIGSNRGSLGGNARGLSNPRSGLGAGSNPIANPAPSLTPSEVLNPRGSLSAGQVANPDGSLNRPRTGGAKPASQSRAGQTVTGVPNQPDATARAGAPGQNQAGREALRLIPVPSGSKLRASALELMLEIEKILPDGPSPLAREVERLLKVDPESEMPNAADRRQLQTVETSMRAFQAGVVNAKDTEIIESSEFQDCYKSLVFYLADPVDRLRPQLNSAFAELRKSLRAFENGQSWQAYLIPQDFADATAPIQATGKRTKSLLERYQRISKDPAMIDVAQLNGFLETQEVLEQMVEVGTAIEEARISDRSENVDAGSRSEDSSTNDEGSAGTNED